MSEFGHGNLGPAAVKSEKGLTSEDEQSGRETGTVFVGGVEHVSAGWAEYEIDKRAEAYKHANSLESNYAGRTNIHADDAVRSILSARGGAGVLRKATQRFSTALKGHEARLMGAREFEQLTLPALTSAHLDDLAANAEYGADARELWELSRGVDQVAESMGEELWPDRAAATDLPALPTEVVRTDNVAEVSKLEQGVKQYATEMESRQRMLAKQMLEVAGRMAKSTEVTLDHREPKRSSKGWTGKTRGEEVDEAALKSPMSLLKHELPWQGSRMFDVQRGVPVKYKNSAGTSTYSEIPGIYNGINYADDLTRSTVLTPMLIVDIAFKTSARWAAWCVINSPEGRFAIRADHREGRTMNLDIDAIIKWIIPRLKGSPLHKIDLDEYLTYLRGLGLKIYESHRVHQEVRFDMIDVTRALDWEKNLAALRSLTEDDFAALDWTEYDKLVGSKACSSQVEISGNVDIDLDAKKIKISKNHMGTFNVAILYARSYINFHTHPTLRSRGIVAEPPSGVDIKSTLNLCALNLQAWYFISAPEGTYIVRPSELLSATYLRNPMATVKSVVSIYDDSILNCVGSVVVCAAAAITKLKDAGFVAYFHDVPCTKLHPRPDLFSQVNREVRHESRSSYEKLLKLSPEQVAEADWSEIKRFGMNPQQNTPKWQMATMSNSGVVKHTGVGYDFENANSSRSYPTWATGLLFVVNFPDEDEFPELVPRAALDATYEKASQWAWMIFLSPTRVTVFRSDSEGVQIYGPVDQVLTPQKAPRKPAKPTKAAKLVKAVKPTKAAKLVKAVKPTKATKLA